jgi:hypothetical protein
MAFWRCWGSVCPRTMTEEELAAVGKENGCRWGTRLKAELLVTKYYGWSWPEPLRWATTLRAFS